MSIATHVILDFSYCNKYNLLIHNIFQFFFLFMFPPPSISTVNARFKCFCPVLTTLIRISSAHTLQHWSNKNNTKKCIPLEAWNHDKPVRYHSTPKQNGSDVDMETIREESLTAEIERDNGVFRSPSSSFYSVFSRGADLARLVRT